MYAQSFRVDDLRSSRQAADERRRMRKQVADWPERGRDDDVRKQTIDVLQRRRADNPGALQFEAVENDGLDVLVVSGELLITTKEFDALGDDPRAALDELGLSASAVEGVEGVLVLREAADGGRVRGRTAGTAERLRKRGIPARPSYVSPLGMIRKSEGGPERTAWTQARPGAPVSGPRVAVIDTGITSQTRTDGWLTGLAVPGDNVDELDVLPSPDHLLDLGAGHGTFAAGVVQQVAPGADIRVYRALDTDGLGSETAVATAIVRAVDEGATIVNLSLGTDVLDGTAPLSLRAAVEQVAGRALLVCAAGNTGDERPVYPAAFCTEYDHVVSVAALARDDGTIAGLPSAVIGPDHVVGAPWSTRGDVTCSTFGEAVVSVFVEGTESPEADPTGPDTFPADAWAAWSGTSFATPQIAGAIVRVLQDPATSGLTPRQALDQVVLAGATPLAGFGSAVVILPV